MLWKEIDFEIAHRLRNHPLILTLLTGAATILGSVIFPLLLAALAQQVPGEQRLVHELVEIGCPIFTCVLLLVVACCAAGCISREREQKTLDSLLTTPLDDAEILYGKWLGSILSVRWCGVFVAAVWVLAVLAGSLHVLAVPLLVSGMLVYAAFAASLGLWFSAVSRSAAQATFRTLLTIGAVSGMLALTAHADNYWGGPSTNHAPDVCTRFLRFGLTPPMPLVVLSFDHASLVNRRAFNSLANIRCALLGLIYYALAAWILWKLTLTRFGRLTGRMPLHRCKSPPPTQPPVTDSAAGPRQLPATPQEMVWR